MILAISGNRYLYVYKLKRLCDRYLSIYVSAITHDESYSPELMTLINELHPLSSRIADLKKQTLEKEASLLKAILDKLTPLVPLLSEDYEPHYRREIVILTSEERVQLEAFSFFSEYRLVLYENGLLVRTHRYGQSMDHGQPMSNGRSMDHGQSIDKPMEASQVGWENTDEDVLTPEAAILAFGFTDISKGLIKALGEASSMITLKEELECDLAALTKALESLL